MASALLLKGVGPPKILLRRNLEGTTCSLNRGSKAMELELKRRAKSWQV